MALDSFKAVQAFIDGVAAALTTANNRSQYVLWPPNPLGGDQMDNVELTEEEQAQLEQAELEDLQGRVLEAVARCNDIAAEYDELADEVARIHGRVTNMATYTVKNPEDWDADSPRLLQADAIVADHLHAGPSLDRLGIQLRGRAGAWRALAVQYAAAGEQ